MMRIVTSEQMREIDRIAIEERKIPSRTLMENAGKQVAAACRDKLHDPHRKVIYIFCGKGNNGGDGFVAARHLTQMNARVFVFLIGKHEEIKGDARRNLDLALQMRIPVVEIMEENELDDLCAQTATMQSTWTYSRPEPDMVIDALLGTGAKGDIQGVMKKAIELINALRKPVIAVDIPSGLNADTGETTGVCVSASWTVTMGLPKTGFFLPPGSEKTGELIIADIGFPEDVTRAGESGPQLLTRNFIKTLLPLPRKANTHKGDYGRVLVIAGSPGMTGAACLCAESCLRSGAGLVTVAVPESSNPVVAAKLTESMTLPVDETAEGTLSVLALNKLISFAEKCDAVALGPGMSTHRETRQLVHLLVEKLKTPFVADADGINCLCGEGGIQSLKKKQAPCILTPHPGELARLLNVTTADIQNARIQSAERAQNETGCALILKGAYSIIANAPDRQIFINSTGNPGMATGGSGDVLTGMVAGFLAQKLTPLHAALLATYLHGLAGDMARDKTGELCLIASDIIRALPEAVKLCQSSPS